MRQSLNAIASVLTNGECDLMTLDWSKLRYQHTSAIRIALKGQYTPATVNKMLCALRRVLKEALRLDLIEPIDYAKAVDLGTVRDKPQIRGRALSRDEINRLLEVCFNDSTPQGIRDAALISILRGAGLRRAEVVKLELRDLDAKTGGLEVRCGKGRKDRLVYLPTGAIGLVTRWLNFRGDAPGALLCPIRKGGQIQRRNMCPDAVLKILRKRAKEAGIDIVTVQKLAGHASPVTTAKYDRRGEEVKRRAVQKLGF